MALTAHKAVATSMRYLHTEDKPVREAAEPKTYVLHCFQKKTQATSQRDKDIATARYRAVVNARKATP